MDGAARSLTIMPVIGSDLRREFLFRLILGRTDLDGVSDEDVAAAESFASGMGIIPYWFADVPEPAPEAVPIDKNDIVAVAEDRLAFVARMIAIARPEI